MMQQLSQMLWVQVNASDDCRQMSKASALFCYQHDCKSNGLPPGLNRPQVAEVKGGPGPGVGRRGREGWTHSLTTV